MSTVGGEERVGGGGGGGSCRPCCRAGLMGLGRWEFFL